MISKPQVKYIQSLGQKKHRDEEGLFIAEGPKLVKELLQNKTVVVKSLYATGEWINENENWLSTTEVTEVSDKELERISQLTTPNQVVALVQKFCIQTPRIAGKISLVLNTIQDPGNMGTIIRTADWFGIEQIICSDDCADMYNPKVVQSTMGSIARVNVFYTDLSAWLPQQNSISIYAAMLEGKDVTKMKAITQGLIVIGNESKGIDKKILSYITEKITIPHKASLNNSGGSHAESLNAAVATGIILSHLV